MIVTHWMKGDISAIEVFFVENPPVASVEKAWLIASKGPIPPIR